MRGTPGDERTENGDAHAAMEPRALLASASATLEAFTRARTPTHAELFLRVERRLSLEHDAGAATLNHGESWDAAARVAWDERRGHAALPLGSPTDLERVLESAERHAAPGAGGPLPVLTVGPTDVPAGPPVLQPERAAKRMEHLLQSAVPQGTLVQAAVLTQVADWSALIRESGTRRVSTGWREELFIRCETARGAVVDAVASAREEDEEDFDALRVRLAEAVEALEGPAETANPELPLVLRPAVAAPLVAGLIWLLRGDVAAATPALARAVGRKVFPSVLGVVDDPHHPRGTRHRSVDDEGVPMHAQSFVEEGRLLGFLHSASTAARLGSTGGGRGLRAASAPPSPEGVNPYVVPRGTVLPEHYTELVARVETFTTMPRPGTVTLVAAGWEVRAGQRVRRVAPMELDLPVLETFRALRGVGSDLTFFPTAEGCGTPTLVLPPYKAG
ncbi:metallopeptidase TldD-related protein [Pyxidicoccus trucidator]|uniref:metallopeptidase TldD-related protein n=1 Tax=Pyxidicoccus trucidator TaxID=2709662 RepID=UPI001F08518B|nr:metallopeptidase TldD-related protein [Pyxidicoccus trucidator]